MTFTFENIVSFFGLLLAGLAALAGVANWLLGKISSSSDALSADLTEKIDDAMNRADRAFEKAEKAQIDLSTYKLEVAEKYAKNELLKAMEESLLKRFDAIVTELHGMRTDFNKAMVAMAGNNSNNSNKRGTRA